jgi:phosphonate transport system substrate-binding protein
MTRLVTLARRVAGLAFALLATAAPAADPPTYSVAIVPQFSSQQLNAEWQPLLKRVGDRAGVRLVLRFYPTIPEFESGFRRGETDFIYANPYHVVMAHRDQGYVPLVRDQKSLTGILLVAAKGPVKSPADLEGKTVAFPAPNAFGASLLIRAQLAEEMKVRIEPVYVKTHANVYRQVALGEVAAGGGVNQTFNDQPPELRAQLRVLHETPGAAPHAFGAHPRVPAKVRNDVTAAFLALVRNEPGKRLAADARIPEPVAADYARDYAPLARLNLEKFVVIEKK